MTRENLPGNKPPCIASIYWIHYTLWNSLVKPSAENLVILPGLGDE